MLEIAQVIFARQLSEYERGQLIGDGISKLLFFVFMVGMVFWYIRKKKTKE